MKIQSLSHFAFVFVILFAVAPGVARALNSVSYSNGIDPAVVITDGGLGDDNMFDDEITVDFTLEDPIGDDWVATGTIYATTTKG